MREWIEIPLVKFYLANGSVLPRMREWIEIAPIIGLSCIKKFSLV